MSSQLSDDLELGDGAQVGPYCILGIDGESSDPLRIGARATLRSHVVMYRGTVVGADFHAGHHVLVREWTTIGASVSIGSGSIIEHHVTVGDGVRIHSGCFVPEHTVLHAGAWLGPGVIVTNAKHPNRADTKATLQGVTVEAGAVVGAGSVLLPGVVIGVGATVGAGAVVVHDVPPHATVVGNPGRILP